MNKEYTGDLKPISKFLPWRRKVKGVTPGMKNRWVNSKKDEEKESQWCYPKAKPNETQKRQIVSRCTEIGTRFLFQNFMYRFGGETFIQMRGGPIGARVTMCAARLVMQSWSRQYSSILLRSRLRIPYHTGYVDDGRQGSTTLRLGAVFKKEEQRFVICEQQKQIDEEMQEPTNKRMSRLCKEAMNSINEDLTFTTEVPADFENNRLPTLDFELWLVCGRILHS